MHHSTFLHTAGRTKCDCQELVPARLGSGERCSLLSCSGTDRLASPLRIRSFFTQTPQGADGRSSRVVQQLAKVKTKPLSPVSGVLVTSWADRAVCSRRATLSLPG